MSGSCLLSTLAAGVLRAGARQNAGSVFLLGTLEPIHPQGHCARAAGMGLERGQSSFFCSLLPWGPLYSPPCSLLCLVGSWLAVYEEQEEAVHCIQDFVKSTEKVTMVPSPATVPVSPDGPPSSAASLLEGCWLGREAVPSVPQGAAPPVL